MKRAVTVTSSVMDVSIFVNAYLHLHSCKVTGRQQLEPLLCAKKGILTFGLSVSLSDDAWILSGYSLI